MKLKEISFVMENCEAITISGEYIGHFIVDKIEKGIYRLASNHIIDVDGQLYAIDWMRGLTECQENEYLEQPYKVKKVEKVITKTEITYEPEGE